MTITQGVQYCSLFWKKFVTCIHSWHTLLWHVIPSSKGYQCHTFHPQPRIPFERFWSVRRKKENIAMVRKVWLLIYTYIKKLLLSLVFCISVFHVRGECICNCIIVKEIKWWLISSLQIKFSQPWEEENFKPFHSISYSSICMLVYTIYIVYIPMCGDHIHWPFDNLRHMGRGGGGDRSKDLPYPGEPWTFSGAR